MMLVHITLPSSKHPVVSELGALPNWPYVSGWTVPGRGRSIVRSTSSCREVLCSLLGNTYGYVRKYPEIRYFSIMGIRGYSYDLPMNTLQVKDKRFGNWVKRWMDIVVGLTMFLHNHPGETLPTKTYYKLYAGLVSPKVFWDSTNLITRPETQYYVNRAGVEKHLLQNMEYSDMTGTILRLPVELMPATPVISFLVQTLRIWATVAETPGLSLMSRYLGPRQSAIIQPIAPLGTKLLPFWFYSYGGWDYWAFATVLLGAAFGIGKFGVTFEDLTMSSRSQYNGVNGYRSWLAFAGRSHPEITYTKNMLRQDGVKSLISARENLPVRLGR